MRQNKQIWTIFVVIVMLLGVYLLPKTYSAVAESTGALEPQAYLPIVLKPVGDVLFGPVHSGEGTYYWEADGTGNCLFDKTDNLMIAAMNTYDYGNADLCGAYIQATGPKGSVVVRIVDRCANCDDEQVDFSPEAFAVIADIPDGRVDITWQLISPAITTPIEYHFDSASHEYWAGIQVRNHRNPITKLDYWDGSKWVNIPRALYNRFDVSGIGTGSFKFRVTDYFGNQIVDSNIPYTIGSSTPGASQFPPPP